MKSHLLLRVLMLPFLCSTLARAADTTDIYPREAPRVISVHPAKGSTNVPTNSEIRIQFDQPMDPAAIEMRFGQGGLKYFDEKTYDAEKNEFTIPVVFEPGQRQVISLSGTRKLRVNSGFISSQKIGARSHRWGFVTAPLQVPPNAPPPKLVSSEHTTGSSVACLSRIQLTFDQPMNPDLYELVGTGEPGADRLGTAFIADAHYDEEAKRFDLLLALPHDSKNALRLQGFRSINNTPAPPITLRLRTERTLFSDDLERHFEEAGKNPDLHKLLGAIHAARAKISSLVEHITVMRGGKRKGSNIAVDMSSNRSTFKFQGKNQFYTDVSGPMLANAFILAFDGKTCWQYLNYKPWYSGRQERLAIVPAQKIDEVELSFADPFDLQRQDIQSTIQKNKLEYQGTDDLNGKPHHIIKSTHANLHESGIKPQIFFSIKRWWIDVETLLVTRILESTHLATQATTFEYDQINQPIPDAEFAPITVKNVAAEGLPPLQEGQYARFIAIADGAAGHMSVLTGTRGDGGYSVGLK